MSNQITSCCKFVTNKADLKTRTGRVVLGDEGLKRFKNNCSSMLKSWKHVPLF